MEPATTSVHYYSALHCLAVCARLRGIAVDPEQLLHTNPGGADLEQDLLRAALRLGFKARAVNSDLKRLAASPLPVLVQDRCGVWRVVAGIEQNQVLVWSPAAGSQRMDVATFTSWWCGRVILLRHESATGAADKFGWTWFLPSLTRHRRLLSEVLLASLFVQLLALLTPLFFQVVIDKVLVHNGLTTLDVLALGLLIASLFEVSLTGLRNYVLSHTSARIDVRLGADLFAHLMSLPASWFGARRVGEVVARAKELDHLRTFLTGPVLTVVLDLAFALVFLALLRLYSDTLFLVVVAFFPVYALLGLLATPVLRRRIAEQGQRAADLQAFLTESVSAMETIKSCAVEPRQRRHWEDLLAAHARSAWQAGLIGNVASQVAALLGKLSLLLILWFGARLVLAGEMTVGQLVAFNMIAARVNGPVLRLVQLWQELQQAGVSLQRLKDIFESPREPQLWSAGHTPLPRIRGGISFAQVGFQYQPGGEEILKEMSLEIAPGTILGIVGPSGSGKSTLARLLQRMVVPQRGRILLDGVNLSLLDPAWLRRRVAVVQQEGRLFHRSVRENIALGDTTMDDAQVVRAATLAGAHEFIIRLSQGYDTLLGEQGCTLSGGQRQRIALARALAASPPVLILDEATSALDFESEQAIQCNMSELCQGRTVIIIAHRLSALQCATEIVVLDQGCITEQGSPQELCRRNGYFARLVRAQIPNIEYRMSSAGGK